MQNSTSHTRPTYIERLTPNLWLLVIVALVGPMVSLVFVPIGATTALAIGGVVSIVLLLGFILLAPSISVEGTVLRAGRAHIDAKHLGEPTFVVGAEAQKARGTHLPARGWHMIRGGIDGIVVVPNTDPADEVTAWTISSRTPDRLTAAIQDARART